MRSSRRRWWRWWRCQWTNNERPEHHKLRATTRAAPTHIFRVHFIAAVCYREHGPASRALASIDRGEVCEMLGNRAIG